MEDSDNSQQARRADIRYVEDLFAERVHARYLDIVDSNGKARIQLFTTADGAASITVNNQNGQTRAQVGLDTDGRPGLVFRDKDEKRQASLFIDDDEMPLLKLYDQREQLRVALYIAENRPALVMYDEEERFRATLTLEGPDENGTPYLVFHNKNEERQVALTVAADGNEGLLLQDRQGNDHIING